MAPELILTPRLCLRPFVVADGPAVVDGLNDLQVSAWLAEVPHPFSAAHLRLLKDTNQTAWPHWMVITLENEPIGVVSTGAHFGFWIARAHWGQGYGFEAAAAALDTAFQMSDIIQSGYFVGNSASARILNRLGFKIVGRGKSHCRALERDLPDVTLELCRVGATK